MSARRREPGRARGFAAALALLFGLCGLPPCASAAATGLQRDVVFSDYAPLSRSSELVRRTFSPLAALRLQAALARLGRSVREQSIELANERFVVYVPTAAPPPGGYALLVFIPPWPQAEVPEGWPAVLERHDTIFVSAANSGNDASVVDRREPLALLAAYNLMRRYPVDPQRVFVGGFSGGSRVALRLALAYPDLFRGALLDAGSDPIGTAEIPLPPADLFRQFRDATQLVYLTGTNDTVHLAQDARSRQSMQDWCVARVDTASIPFTAHAVAPAIALNRALQTLLEARAPPSDERLAACRQRVERELSAQLQRVQARLDGGDAASARTLLERVDARYGGLAAPRSAALLRAIDAKPQGGGSSH
ncbi:MAG TPA: hypothetical protein VF216_13275 [Mizugakiibacter sp.]